LPAGNQQAKQYLLIAAGSGITPVMSILKSILYTEPASCITLIYGNRDRNSIIFKDDLDALKNRYMQRLMVHHIFSRERTDAPIFEGRIDPEKCEVIFKHLVYLKQLDEIFICGPGGMIDTVRNYLEANHFPKEKIHYELFTAGSKQQPLTAIVTEAKHDESDSANVTIKLDGVQSSFKLAYHGASILDAALSRGADLPYACKSGVCCTCKGKLIQGKVHMDQNYGLEAEEMAAGYILTCQSHPLTEEIMVDFD
jgi:ring-1,2-phenylacetyl-CoA epoxidase subunit PaaE